RDVGGGNQGGSPAECTGAKRGGLYALPPVNAAGSEVPGQPVEELILGGQQPIGPEQLMQNHDAPRSEERRVGKECRHERRLNTRFSRDWSSDVCSSDLVMLAVEIKEGVLLSARGQKGADCTPFPRLTQQAQRYLVSPWRS